MNLFLIMIGIVIMLAIFKLFLPALANLYAWSFFSIGMGFVYVYYAGNNTKLDTDIREIVFLFGYLFAMMGCILLLPAMLATPPIEFNKAKRIQKELDEKDPLGETGSHKSPKGKGNDKVT